MGSLQNHSLKNGTHYSFSTFLLHRTRSLTTLEFSKRAKSLHRLEATVRMFKIYATSTFISDSKRGSRKA